MGITGLQTYDSSNAYNNAATGRKSSSDDKNATISDFIKKFGEARQITAQELKEDKDWRDMTDSEWGKLLSGFDKYIDTVKEQIKEMEEKQKKAAQKAAVKAAPDQRTTAASSAALHAAAGGSVDAATAQGEDKENQTGADGEPAHEKNWTKNLQTDDQTILRVAKRAQEMESMAIAKYQEAMAKYREEIKKNTPAEEDENHVLTKEEALQKYKVTIAHSYLITGWKIMRNHWKGEQSSRISPHRCLRMRSEEVLSGKIQVRGLSSF